MRTPRKLWTIDIRGYRAQVVARTFGHAVRKAYRRIAEDFRRTSGLDDKGHPIQFPPLVSRDGGWHDVAGKSLETT